MDSMYVYGGLELAEVALQQQQHDAVQVIGRCRHAGVGKCHGADGGEACGAGGGARLMCILAKIQSKSAQSSARAKTFKAHSCHE